MPIRPDLEKTYDLVRNAIQKIGSRIDHTNGGIAVVDRELMETHAQLTKAAQNLRRMLPPYRPAEGNVVPFRREPR